MRQTRNLAFKTYDGFEENGKDFFWVTALQDQIDDWLNSISYVHEVTNTRIILDDCATSRDVKKKTNEWTRESSISTGHKGIGI